MNVHCCIFKKSKLALHATQGTRAAPIMKILTIHDSVESERLIFSRTLEGQAITLPRAKAPNVAAVIISHGLALIGLLLLSPAYLLKWPPIGG